MNYDQCEPGFSVMPRFQKFISMQGYSFKLKLYKAFIFPNFYFFRTRMALHSFSHLAAKLYATLFQTLTETQIFEAFYNTNQKVVSSIPTVVRHIFQACPVWIYTQSNITSIIFTWVHYTNTEKKNHEPKRLNFNKC
jgi:hypothetical protein